MKLQIQHESCRAPLPVRELPTELAPHIERVLFFDPLPVYERLSTAGHGSCYKRVNSLWIGVLFPTLQPGVCACGCEQMLSGRNTRYATKDCRKFVLAVYYILTGKSSVYTHYLWIYNNYEMACRGCGELNIDYEVDHIRPVFAGGGLCWLSNFQPMCKDCHKQKTKRDFKIY